jgi:peptidoglycan/xylan/chitin deacetylase (PgdA/CDA1 family)
MIFEIHGAITKVAKDKMLHRRLLPLEDFLDWIRQRREFVNLADACQGRGDAITIDDGTRLGAETALAVSRLGHPVTLFVNPSNIVRAANYYFLEINAIVDHLAGRRVEIDGVIFDFESPESSEATRRKIKESYLALSTEAECENYAISLASNLGTSFPALPYDFTTIDLEMLSTLRRADVEIANHGWAHVNYDRLDQASVIEQIAKAENWLAKTVGSTGRTFAVPFGKFFVDVSAHLSSDLVWLLADRGRLGGPVGANSINRISLDDVDDLTA